uniref:RBR-type E3 ubiquitin transferase n=1 Tax=Mycena chlorophos TaxID=658473 RepID=A0ABQ0M7E4_MYCCL|nr:predicted protein [Mycena chlorophos]
METTSTLQQPHSFHPTFQTSISAYHATPDCSLHLLYALPPLIFVDPYELANRVDFYSFQHAGPSNLELPVFALDPERSNSSVLLTVKAGVETDALVDVQVPLLVRYGAVSNDSQSGFIQTEVPWPVVFHACSGSDSESQIPLMPDSFASPFASKSIRVISTPENVRVAVEIVRTPVGNSSDVRTVELGTALVIIVCFLYLLRAMQRPVLRRTAKEKVEYCCSRPPRPLLAKSATRTAASATDSLPSSLLDAALQPPLLGAYSLDHHVFRLREGDSDGDDGMEDIDDFKVAAKPSRKAYDLEYESLSQSAVEQVMASDVEYITGILGIDTSTASLLLRHMSWNKERLIEKYMDNASKVLVDAGVSLPDPETVRPVTSKRPVARSRKRAPSNDSTSFTCSICFDDSPDLKPLALECGHKACSGCWDAYVSAKLTEEAEHACRCMAEGCALVAPDAFIRSVISADHYARFQELQELVKGGSSSSAVKEHKFCFGCVIDSDHRPVVCGVALLWLKKCRDDSETANWIKSNTKECPKCVSTIEKNGGCNHMTCKKCKNEFCWVCMGPWSEHGTAWYSCNRYDEKGGVDARDAQSRSRASLERYLHYYNRWANHEQSAKLARELFTKTEKKMEEMQVTSTLTWIEVQFMKKAVEELDKCRVTLKWTYAMAYYLAKGNEKEMFEDNQRDLERAVEELSELVEAPLDPETITSLRQKVTDKTVYVQKRNAIVLDDTAQGFLDGRWAWNVAVEGFDKPAETESQEIALVASTEDDDGEA